MPTVVPRTSRASVVTESTTSSKGSYYDYELFIARGGNPEQYNGELSQARQEHLKNINRENTRLSLRAPRKPIGIPEELLALQTLLNQYQPCAHQKPVPHEGLRFGLRQSTFDFDDFSKASNIHEIKNAFLGLFAKELKLIPNEQLRPIKSSFSFSSEGVTVALIADPHDFAKGVNQWISDPAVAAGILLDREKIVRNLVIWLVDSSSTGRFREDAMDKLHNAYINFGTLIEAVQRRLPKQPKKAVGATDVVPGSTTVSPAVKPAVQSKSRSSNAVRALVVTGDSRDYLEEQIIRVPTDDQRIEAWMSQ